MQPASGDADTRADSGVAPSGGGGAGGAGGAGSAGSAGSGVGASNTRHFRLATTGAQLVV